MSARSAPRPRPPAVVTDWVDRWSGGPIDVDGPDLLEAALRALREARTRPGRSREAAEALLAADALLTYAVEDAADADDPDAALETMIGAISREASL